MDSIDSYVHPKNDSKKSEDVIVAELSDETDEKNSVQNEINSEYQEEKSEIIGSHDLSATHTSTSTSPIMQSQLFEDSDHLAEGRNNSLDSQKSLNNHPSCTTELSSEYVLNKKETVYTEYSEITSDSNEASTDMKIIRTLIPTDVSDTTKTEPFSTNRNASLLSTPVCYNDLLNFH